MKRRYLLIVAGVLGAAVLAAGLFLFEPWRLWTSSTVVEQLPGAPASSAPATAGAPSAQAPSTARSEAAVPIVLRAGRFISHEHATTGRALVVQLPDGSRVLRLEGLDTSDGPDLRVWLTDAPVLEGPDGWHVFDDGRYLDLGALKANRGDHNYVIPPGTDLEQYSSVSIWCRRFAVSFGAASLAA
ncbi:DM13 domain-containing protein [Arthrobacter sp. I2-34]|uniref:DM13 domain-containing protein n=1 Tax=Arthrobacter hankyongi TaxID=2904801 RepID=A0ABS9L8E3_9MICC|nr:DM13 domain-containing protein [Arthrobacter hankyongi]MCG2622910.1 DM13 domain-containing protein [Arthrobacter hankyongi]